MTSKRTTDEVTRGTDKDTDDMDPEDEQVDEKRKEAMRYIKKQHNAWLLAMTEAKVRLGKHDNNTYQP